MADTLTDTTAARSAPVPAWLDVETVALAAITTLVALACVGVIPVAVGWTEGGAVVSGAASVWLLARNNVWGWWVGIVSVVLFAILFFSVRLFAEVGIQAFYVVTSLWGVWLWTRAGDQREGVTVRFLPWRNWLWIVPLFAVSWAGLNWLLVEVEGAAPFWDSLTAIMSVLAQLLLMARYATSWWVWIAVDVIYVPLFLSRGLTLTSVLYVGFLAMAIAGLVTFRRAALNGERDS